MGFSNYLQITLFVITLLQSCLITQSGKAPLVGIVGGGIGGTATAHFLRELIPDAKITLFEKSNSVGGRLNLTTIYGNGYETGGAIIHPKNKYAVDLAKSLGLEQGTLSGETLSIVKDDEYLFNTSKWTIINIIKTLSRYGLNYNYLDSYIKDVLRKFENIYKFQEQGKSFTTPTEMLEATDPLLLNLTKVSFRSVLQDRKFSQKFIDEILQAITFVNYGQDVSIHGFVGCVAAAGAGSDLWFVRNGNILLPKELARNSNAQIHINSEIAEVHRLSDNRFSLKKNGGVDAGEFDYVVLALPLEASKKIVFEDFPSMPYDYASGRRYHRTVATMVSGWPHEKYRHRSDIISCVPNWYNSLGIVRPTVLTVAEKYPVYKVFSGETLTEQQLDSLFSERHVVEVHDWLAYPEYDTIPAKMPGFVLSPRLYYLNAIEWAASAMEMSLISAKNIALLINEDRNNIP